MVALPTKSRSAAPSCPSVEEASIEEGREMIDRAARRSLDISGDEFIERWYGGYYAANPDQPGVMSVALLLSFIQPRQGAEPF
ncbi:MAG: hypothetical protein HY332_15785 [Chloroflexi bacterium]|nr:hypothetical protein [Chloroflexota bacterium]